MPKAHATNSPAPPAPTTLPLSDVQRLHLENLVLRQQIADMHAAQAREAALNLVREVLTQHGVAPSDVAAWRVDAAGGRLVRVGDGIPQDTGGSRESGA